MENKQVNKSFPIHPHLQDPHQPPWEEELYPDGMGRKKEILPQIFHGSS